jgi:RHS repeat-associated protein
MNISGRLAVLFISLCTPYTLAQTTGMAPGARPAIDAAGTTTLGPYVYDGTGNIVAIGADSYTYDDVGRLRTVASGDVPLQTYVYDAFGNLTAIVNHAAARCVGGRDCGVARSVVSATNRLVESPGGTTYDDAGNLVQLDSASYRYSYDAAGMMRSMDGAAPRQFLYTASDERIASRAASEWSWTVRDLRGAVLSEYVSADGTSAARWSEDYVYRGALLLAANLPQGRRHFHVDHLGTPRLITDDTHRQLGFHKYLPFGAELDLGLQESPEELRKFTAHERDVTGDAHDLDYMRARYYVPVSGRFLSPDTVMDIQEVLGNPQEWNRYTYVRNNPLRYVDPDGHTPRELTEEQLTKIAKEVVRHAAKGTDPIKIANMLIVSAGDFRASGKAITAALTAAGVTLPAKGMAALSHVNSVTVETKNNIRKVTIDATGFVLPLPGKIPDLNIASKITANVASTAKSISVSDIDGLSTKAGSITGIDASISVDAAGHRSIQATLHARALFAVPVYYTTPSYPLP